MLWCFCTANCDIKSCQSSKVVYLVPKSSSRLRPCLILKIRSCRQSGRLKIWLLTSNAMTRSWCTTPPTRIKRHGSSAPSPTRVDSVCKHATSTPTNIICTFSADSTTAFYIVYVLMIISTAQLFACSLSHASAMLKLASNLFTIWTPPLVKWYLWRQKTVCYYYFLIPRVV